MYDRTELNVTNNFKMARPRDSVLLGDMRYASSQIIIEMEQTVVA